MNTNSPLLEVKELKVSVVSEVVAFSKAVLSSNCIVAACTLVANNDAARLPIPAKVKPKIDEFFMIFSRTQILLETKDTTSKIEKHHI